MKIDTQGMSFGDSNGGRSLEEQRAAIPPLQVRELNLISDSLKVELKQLINEVLDERELKKETPYPSYHTDYKGCVDFLVDSMSAK